ncbi:MAG: hypothetical protein V3S64_05775 [bacterium]
MINQVCKVRNDQWLIDLGKAMEEKELANIKLLRMREWVEIIDSVNFTLPEDVISIPALGYSALNPYPSSFRPPFPLLYP